jgi:adenine-specific DNA-methyltransferase
MSIESIKHPYEKRPHIPSQEEAGMEAASPAASYKASLELPLNPVVTRGQDPELFWMNKYGPEGGDERLNVDIRSLYRHEHISPEIIMKRFYRMKVENPESFLFSVNELFGNAVDVDELDKVGDYYQHQDGWTNRMILGDSLLSMTSLLEREGMKGKVQCIYIDPPYGIKYGKNWQIKLNSAKLPDSDPDDALSSEPEQIKAYRDTWELGIHSYLQYLHARLLVSKELLSDSGSCFIQIGQENVHLVRCLMDEVFGSSNFVSEISFITTSSNSSDVLDSVSDYILWYALKKESIKYRQLYQPKGTDAIIPSAYNHIELKDGTRRNATVEEKEGRLPNGARLYALDNLTSARAAGTGDLTAYDFGCKKFTPGKGTFKTDKKGMDNLERKKRLEATENRLGYVRYLNDFPAIPLNNIWVDTSSSFMAGKKYVVTTNTKVIQRCLLMTTDPGDLVLDPTCGSGTSAFVAEQWGRRWITIDTSRIALNIAKARLMTAAFPYYQLADESGKDVRQGFVYKKVPHITLKSLANDEPAEEETLYDQPTEDKKRLRVAGPFTVETLQSFDTIAPAALEERGEYDESFERRIFEHLTTAGIRNGARNEQAVFTRVERLPGAYLTAAGWFKRREKGAEREAKAYFHIGPKFGSVSRRAVNEAAKEARSLGDADWLVILGFAFDSDLDSLTDKSMGTYEISKVRMNDDLLQEGLLKKDKKAASFVTIGEPDVVLNKLDNGYLEVEIRGLDIYDPIKDQVKPRDIADIAYWMLDDDYDGSNFIVRQVFFCGGDKDEFAKWKKGLDSLASQQAKKKFEATVKIEVDDDAFERLYGFKSHPILPEKKGQKIAVRVVSQFGEEATRVLEAD